MSTMAESLARDSESWDDNATLAWPETCDGDNLAPTKWGVSYMDQVKERIKHAMESRDDKINPPHYKNVAAGKQYMELMVDMLDGKEGVEAHLFGQVYKYLMRCGNKDEEVQELKKAQWYLNALIKFKTEGVVM